MAAIVQTEGNGWRRLIHYAVWLGILFAFLCLFSRPAHAVPAWARMTGMACSSCHVGGTSRLNAFGQDFQTRGHRLKMDQRLSSWRQLTNYFTLSARVREDGTNSTYSSPTVENTEVLSGGPLNSSLSFFTEYNFYTRVLTGPAPARFADAYLQYTGNAKKDDFWWLRAGRLYPFAIYAAGAGGRETLSRPRVLTDKLGGFIPAVQRRSFGVSLGSATVQGIKLEGSITDGGSNNDKAELPQSLGSYVVLEKNWDSYGSGISLYGEQGWQKGGGQAFSRTGLLARYMNAAISLSGAFIAGASRTAAGQPLQRPTGSYLEAARNFLPETTGFLRYDNLNNTLGNAIRTQAFAFGVSQRIPNRGRVVMEYGHDFAGVKHPHYIYMDTVLMY